MGFFSWNCDKCKLSMRAPFVTNHPELSKVVVLLKDGSILQGQYDGYGRVNGHDIEDLDEPQCFHQHCWEEAGKPTEHVKESEYAHDQGYFFDEGDLDYMEPEPE